MICSLNETQLSDLRKITYKKLSGLKPSESFDLKAYIKDIYQRIEKAAGEEKALQYAQIIPLTIHSVQGDDEINSILAKTDFDPKVIMNLREEFNDIDNVKKYVTEPVRKKSKKELKSELEHENFQLDNLEITDPDDSVLEKMSKAKVENPNVTTFQFAEDKNPDDPNTQIQDDVLAEDKKVFEIVIKKIIKASNEKTIDQNNPVIDDTEVFLKMMSSESFENKHKLSNHKTATAKSYRGVFAVVTDIDGNYLYFDENGNLTTEDKGTVVYQFIRKPYLLEDKLNKNQPALFLIYHNLGKMYKNTLVAASKIAKSSFGMSSKEVLENQTENMNGVYNMRKDIIDNNTSYITQINGGSFGILTSASRKSINNDLQKTVKLTREIIKDAKIISSKDLSQGFAQFFITYNSPNFGEISMPVNIQRGNFDQELANKVADVITTKATNKGRTLSDDERIAYFKVFLNNQKISKKGVKNKNNIFLDKAAGGPLTLTINDEKFEGDAIFTTAVRDKIAEHLPKAIKFGDKGSIGANVNISTSYKDKETYTDYEISGDKFRPVEKDYIDEVVLKYAKPQFTNEGGSMISGFNPYLSYAVPGQFTENPKSFFDIALDSETGAPVRKKTQAEKNQVAEKVVKEKSKAVQKKRTTKVPAAAENVEVIIEHNWFTPFKNDLSEEDANGFNLDRSKALDNFLDKVFTTAADKAAAEAWWANSPLSKYISLNRITQIVNSNAFATFTGTGITLYEGDGGTAVDLYHEAWHGFSQLFLTRDEKIKLYNELKGQPKWANKSFFDIEEDIAEDFRDYARSRGKKEAPKGFLGTVFRRMYQFLQNLIGRVSKQDLATRPRDIASVKELFDKLYRASENPELLQDMQPSTDNMMFTQLNRAKAITSVKDVATKYEPFDSAESLKIVSYLDSLIPDIFNSVNQQRNSSSAPVRVLQTNANRKHLYKVLEKKISERFNQLREDFAKTAAEGGDIDTLELNQLPFLGRMLDNFGDIDTTIDGKDQKGVIAFHMQNSRFKILANKFVELEEDPTDINNSRIVRLDGGNIFSSREAASQETKTILSSIYKVDRNKTKVTVNDEGKQVLSIEYEVDPQTGLYMLLDEREMWSKVAKVLAGSFDKSEMYKRLSENIKDNPEFLQLLSYLPNPQNTDYNDKAEFDIETKFWQDLKKPRLSYVQLNLNITKTADAVLAEARVQRTDFDRSKVLKDWEITFLTVADSKFIVENKSGQRVLDLNNFVKYFKNNINSKNVLEFLNALGIVMDTSNPTIASVISDPNFVNKFAIGHIFDSLEHINKTYDPEKFTFLRNPLAYLKTSLPKTLDPGQKFDSSSRIKELANLQVRFSDKYSNFSAVSPEGNRVWEHFLDNTFTRIMTSLNHAKSWQELTNPDADPNGLFRHMRYLAYDNNTYTRHSVLLKSLFNDLLAVNNPGGKKDNTLVIQNVAGTQLIDTTTNNQEGISTASMDATSKYLQEIHTMLMSGVEEFMRHASKQMSQGIVLKNGLKTYDNKNAKNLYVDIEKFLPTTNSGEDYAFDILSGYLTGEVNRIFKFSSDLEKYSQFTGYTRTVNRKTGEVVMAGQALAAFEDVLSKDTQAKIYAIVDKAVADNQSDFDFSDVYDDNAKLTEEIRKDVAKYFNSITTELKERLDKTKFIDPALRGRIENKGVELTVDESDTTLMKAYAYNSWIHKFETAILGYGDLAQYNHAKEEFHKRNAGFGSGGLGFASDLKSRSFVNKMPKLFNKIAPSKPFDGTLTTAIIKERVIKKSEYYDEYYDALVKDYTKRFGDKTKAKELAKTALKEYNDMKIGDGQGHISFESYRILKNLEGNWLPEQEELYKKLANGEEVSVEDIVQYFPPYKLQYCGAMETTGLPVTSFHKFSLAPIIPGVAKKGTPLYDLHQKMMLNDVDYVVFESGSKVGHLGTGDEIYDDNGNILMNEPFTKNVIFTEFLKNQTEVNSEYKGKSIFSTQMRKLVLDNLYENGVINSPDEKDVVSPLVKRYLDNVSDYTELVKLELLEEIGFDETPDGEYKARDKESIGKLLSLVRNNLDREESYSDEMLNFIDALDSGELLHDLSLHPEALKIEKLLLSLINKRVIKQKVKGEPLVQVSSAFYENNLTESPNFRNATDADKKKWVGSNLLPTYHKKADGKTAAMKVMIALQGDYANLLNLEYKGATIGDIYTLNKAIKDDEWLDANDGANRKAITLVGVRIPVQGLNSMEFMEVYEFLPPQAGNIIIPPAEIVAKSGGDFDIDKLTIFMTNIDMDGKLKERTYKNTAELKASLQNIKDNEDESITKAFKQQKAGVENDLMNDIKEILELPQNFVSLVTPNGTFLLKDIADKLAADVMEYDPFKNYMTDTTTEPEKGKKIISATRVLEPLYNLYKHESNIVGKKTLGLGAIENTMNVLLNSIGALMPETYTNSYSKLTRSTVIGLRHNVRNVNGKDRISLSNLYDVDNVNKIADIFSQAMNGWVDVEKDAWIFFIQGNYEVAPILLYLIKAGVPVKEAIYFVSQPLVREYVDEQRLAKSTFASVLGKAPEEKAFVKFQSASNIINKYFNPSVLPAKGKADVRFETGRKLFDKLMKDRKDKHFTEKEMLQLIQDSKKNNNFKSSDLSLTMFLHYLDIEDQIKGITQVKMNSNPDTNTKSVLSDIETSEARLENLENNPELQPIISALMSNSVISSFFNNKLALSLAAPLFKLRYNDAIRRFIKSEDDSNALRENIKSTFGESGRDNYLNTFRNDLVSYIFQNRLAKTDIKKGYVSYDAKELPSKQMLSDKFGAFVKTNKDGSKTLFYNLKNLEDEFTSGVWKEKANEPNYYSQLGLHPVPANTFTIAKGNNTQAYTRFVMEREYLRSIYPIAETGLEKTAYEEFLANRALDNTFNVNHLFSDPKNAFAVRLYDIILNNPKLVNKFDVLSKLELDNNTQNTMFNLNLIDRDIDNIKANIYTKNLTDLADPVLLKGLANELSLSDQDIENISYLFSRLPLFAYLQSGINKTKSNLVPYVSTEPFLNIMDDAVKDFTELLSNPDKAERVLRDFYYKFNAQNSYKNKDKNRFKNYFTDIDFSKVGTEAATQKATQPSISVEANVILPIGTSGSGKSTFIKSLPQENLVVIEPDAMRVEFTGDINNKSKDKEIYIEAANRAIQAIKQGKQVVFDTTNLTKDKRRPFVEAIKKAIPNANIQYKLMPLDAKLAKQRIKAQLARGENRANVSDETIDRHAESYKQMLEDIKSEDITDYDTQLSTSVEEQTNDLITTPDPNIFLFDDSKDDSAAFYKKLTSTNSTVGFVYNATKFEIDNNKDLPGQGYLRLVSKDTALPFVTSLTSNFDNFSNLAADKYQSVKNYFDRKIQELKNAKDLGNKIALPKAGIGDAKKMPKELFVYLSKRLFEELGYLNPGSSAYKDITEVISNKQGISDDEILASLGFESDPFNCV
jgi:predicted kinase